MIDDNTPKLLRSLAKLIEKPEIKALEISLLKTLEDLIVADSICLYEVKSLKKIGADQATIYLLPVGGENDIEDDSSAPMLLNQQTLFDECYRSQNVTIGPCGTPARPMMRFIHPIVGAKGVTGFLVVENTEHIDRDHELVAILLGFYRNYISLLNDNQRDHLTGLFNRKCFDDKIMKIIVSLSENNKRQADKVQYYLAVLDIDHFKRVNDTLGHLMGDEVLLHFSQCMNDTFREYDMLFRVGGEEFVVVMRNVSLEQATAIMERFRKNIESHYFPQVWQITTSIGITSIVATDLPVTIMDRADQALYYIKENGRNQIAFHEQLIEEGKLKKKNTESDIEMF